MCRVPENPTRGFLTNPNPKKSLKPDWFYLFKNYPKLAIFYSTTQFFKVKDTNLDFVDQFFLTFGGKKNFPIILRQTRPDPSFFD